MNAPEQIIAVLFWLSAGTIFYTYAGYPVIILILSTLFPGTKSNRNTAKCFPRVSLLIAAHNEQDVIEARIENALASDYPAENLEVVIASDGSTDATADIAARYAHRGVRLIHSELRRGKADTINAAIPRLTGDIVVLSDANTQVDPDALRNLARWFTDPAVGVVCGRLELTDPDTGLNADGVYWRYETFLKRCEGRLGALLGANGAIYAIRRRLLGPIPTGAIIDDFVIPLLAKLKTDCRIVYDDQAIAREEAAPTIGAEFRRRARIGEGGFQAIALLWRLLDPRRGWIALAFFSHKILRWCVPFCLLATLLSGALLWKHPLYQTALLLQIAFYAISLAAALSGRKIPRGFRMGQMFVAMNAALFVGFWKWWIGNENSGVWEHVSRGSEQN
jgi:cellulose synthase/poly-beta-1,6-N-acetylglucosamine synthase-like glycosyltransferase